MNSIRFHLKRHNFFQGFSADQLEPLLEFTTEEVYKKNQFIFKSWEVSKKFYLVYNGKISLEIPVPKKSSAIINFVYPGDIIGIDCLYEPHRWYFDAKVLEELIVLAVDAKELKQKIENDKEFGFRFVNNAIYNARKQLLDMRLILLEFYSKDSSEFEIKNNFFHKYFTNQ